MINFNQTTRWKSFQFHSHTACVLQCLFLLRFLRCVLFVFTTVPSVLRSSFVFVVGLVPSFPVCLFLFFIFSVWFFLDFCFFFFPVPDASLLITWFTISFMCVKPLLRSSFLCFFMTVATLPLCFCLFCMFLLSWQCLFLLRFLRCVLFVFTTVPSVLRSSIVFFFELVSSFPVCLFLFLILSVWFLLEFSFFFFPVPDASLLIPWFTVSFMCIEPLLRSSFLCFFMTVASLLLCFCLFCALLLPWEDFSFLFFACGASLLVDLFLFLFLLVSPLLLVPLPLSLLVSFLFLVFPASLLVALFLFLFLPFSSLLHVPIPLSLLVSFLFFFARISSFLLFIVVDSLLFCFISPFIFWPRLANFFRFTFSTVSFHVLLPKMRIVEQEWLWKPALFKNLFNSLTGMLVGVSGRSSSINSALLFFAGVASLLSKFAVRFLFSSSGFSLNNFLLRLASSSCACAFEFCWNETQLELTKYGLDFLSPWFPKNEKWTRSDYEKMDCEEPLNFLLWNSHVRLWCRHLDYFVEISGGVQNYSEHVGRGVGGVVLSPPQPHSPT